MNSFHFRRAAAVSKKEVYHILRDPYTLLLALAMPVFMVIMYGLAIEFNIQDVPISVADADQTQSSRELLDTFASSGYFHIHRVSSPSVAINQVVSQQTRAALIIPPQFQEDLLSGKSSDVQVLVDGSDSSVVGPVLEYVASIRNLASKRIAGFDPPKPYELRTRFLCNPEL